MSFTNERTVPAWTATTDENPTNWADVSTIALCSFTAAVTTFITQFALVLHMQGNGYGGFAVAAVIIATSLPIAVLSPITGRMADRFDSRTLLFGSAILQTVAVAAMTRAESPELMVVAATVAACGMALAAPVSSALIPRMTNPADTAKAIGFNQSASVLGIMTGPPVAGLIMGYAGLTGALYIAVAASLLRALLSLCIRTRRGGVRRAVATAGTKTAPWTLRGDRLLFITVIGAAAALGIICAVNVAEVFLVRETYGASEAMYGLLGLNWTVSMAIAATVFAGVLGKLSRDGHVTYAHFGIIAGSCLTLILLGLPWSTIFALIPFMIIGGAFNAGLNAAMSIAIVRRVDDESRGMASARAGAILNAAIVIGFMFGGLLESIMSPGAIYMTMGAVGLLVVAGFIPFLRRAVRADESVDEAITEILASDSAQGTQLEPAEVPSTNRALENSSVAPAPETARQVELDAASR
ncbi:MFS transporter [Natronoglycomyces albus]|uniref:MFS transporter n=1 Tax=Natronoglycomyces albus TaxID=2811108 RepID=A0A895XPB0_9ACTN|nr:MFS transporter [Natronoglycomyces albus]QSB05219.1 MFS transporter [Natronoglycomyces albus]